MSTSYLQVEGFRLAYTELNEQAENTLVFIHGNSGSRNTWKQQLNDPSLSPYRVVAIDLPGHGESSFSTNPDEDYSPIGTARIMLEAINILSQDKPYLFAAFSYGTNVVAEMINQGARPKGILATGLCCLGGEYTLDKIFKPLNPPSIFFYNEIKPNVVFNFIDELVENKSMVPPIAEDYMETDQQFKPSLFKAAGEGKLSDEVGALTRLDVPLCVIYGEEDLLVYNNYLKDSQLPFWSGQIIELEKCGHFVQADQPSEMNALLLRYASEIFTPAHAL
jgi:pimeloyl-ACP methyl ester carboxylesterase